MPLDISQKSELDWNRVWANVSDFGYWWGEQLSSLWPRVSQSNANSAGPSCEIVRNASGLSLRHSDKDMVTEWQHEGALDNLTDEDWEHVQSLVGQTGTVWLHDEHDLLSLYMELPRSATSSLDDAVRLFVLGASPLKEEAMSWAYASRREGKHIKVDVLVARNRDLDLIDNQFSEHGLLPPAHIHSDGDRVFHFRKPLKFDVSKSWLWPLAVAMPFVAIIIALAITIILADILAADEKSTAEALAAELAPKMREEAKLRETAATARQIMPISSKPVMTDMLEEMASILPKDIWVEALGQTEDGSVEMIIVGPTQEKVEQSLDELMLLRIENTTPESLIDDVNIQGQAKPVRLIVSARRKR